MRCGLRVPKLAILVGLLALLPFSARAGTSIDCEGTEIHELVVKYDADGSNSINASELLTISADLNLPLNSDEADGVVSKYGEKSDELSDSQLCNYLNTLLDSSTASSSSKSSSLRGKSIKPKNGEKDKFAPGKETYAPTPENFGKTKKPTNEKRDLKSVKPEDGGKDLFAPGKETYGMYCTAALVSIISAFV